MLDVTVLDPVGAAVRGLRVDALDARLGRQMRWLLCQHGVLIMREQHVGDAEFLRFLPSFGDLIFTEGETPLDGFPDLNVISNVGRRRPPRSSFHVDTSYVRRPPAYTALRAVRIPRCGGHTLFTNQYAAYESLPERLRAAVRGRIVTHVVTGLELPEGADTSAEHPFELSHPRSGHTALYLSTAQRCRGVSGMTEEAAAQLIADLLAHSTRDDNVLRHAWAPGDVVMWDNRCVMHRADHDGVKGDRVLHRGMVAA